MSGENKNEILEEQRRAREEFLKLKKMQKGELDAGPKPSEVAIVPRTFKEKWQNFWFQYKWYVIGITAVAVTLVILIAQCASVPKYDFSIVYFTYTPAVDQQTDLIADYFEKYGTDVNKDGEINVQVLNCSFFDDSTDVRYRNTQLQKLQAFFAGEYKAMLYITDEESIKFFDNIAEGKNIFEGDPVKLSEEFYRLTQDEDFGSLPEGLQISCRKISGTVLEDNETALTTHEVSVGIMEKIAEN